MLFDQRRPLKLDAAGNQVEVVRRPFAVRVASRRDADRIFDRERQRRGVGRRLEEAVAHISEHAPFVVRGVADDDGAGRGLEPLRGFDEHVAAQKRAELRLRGELLELAQHRGLVGDQGALALAAHRVDQALAMQRGTDHAGGRLERRELRAADLAPLAVRDEAHHADELRADEDRHERFRIVRVAGFRGRLLGAVDDAFVAEHGAAAAKVGRQARMLPAPALERHAFRFLRAVRFAGCARRAPFGGEREAVAVVGLREHQAHAIGVRGLADELQDFRHGGHHVLGLQQQAARGGRRREQALAPLRGRDGHLRRAAAAG